MQHCLNPSCLHTCCRRFRSTSHTRVRNDVDTVVDHVGTGTCSSLLMMLLTGQSTAPTLASSLHPLQTPQKTPAQPPPPLYVTPSRVTSHCSERVVDSYNLVHAYAAQARANGGVIRENCQATDGAFQAEGSAGHSHWRVNLQGADGRRDCICARAVINCAGLHGDSVEHAFLNHASFKIIPRKGDFVVLNGCSLQVPLNHIILPMPNQRTKGVLLTPTLSGHFLIGPTAVDISDREPRSAQCDEPAARHLLTFAREKLKLGSESVVTTYAGLRPATQQQDYVIQARSDKNWVTVAGIRSACCSYPPVFL